VRFEITVEEAGASIAVRDTGTGIPSQQMKAVFEPFVQLGDVQTRAHEGTGLGLTITARLVRLLGGAVHTESEPGVGSLFRVTLPHLPL
jgi:signal transduction histidine kinase